MTMTAASAPIFLCAATKWEAEPLASALGLRRVSEFRWEDDSVALVKTGIGRENAVEALAAVSSAKLLVSTGFAGALQPGMSSGDLVMEVAGLDLEVPQTAREIAAAQKTPFHFGRIAHTDKVLFDPADKAALGKAQRAAAIDMESAAIRAAADRLGVPFLAARVVLDGLDDRLPSKVPAGESFSDLMSYAFGNAAELPLMMKVGLRQKRAMARLAAFLEELLPRL